jgi:hypothetical protein
VKRFAFDPDYLTDPDGLVSLTPGIFLRFYIPLIQNAECPGSGPFLQFDF